MKTKVLIADDQPLIVEALRLLLKSAEYECRGASSPQAALRAFETESFDAVLLDLNYTRDTTSGAEGLDLLARIRAIDDSLPVLVMTAWGTMDLAIQAMQRGASDFILKPWDNAAVMASLHTHIARRQSQHAQQCRAEQENLEARHVQEQLILNHAPKIPGLQIASAWRPARHVGGDYCDVLDLGDGEVGICIADVSGKGLAAALLMSNVQAAVRSLASASLEPSDLCARLNALLCQNTSQDRFVTFFYAVLDHPQKRLRYCNAGHIPPQLLRSDGSILELEEGGPVLGEFPELTYGQGAVDLRKGDQLLCLTDGILEAANAGGEEFGQNQLAAILARKRDLNADQLRDRIMSAAANHCGENFEDDATLLVVGIE
jgi:sigma-B regulation protein RsbU (phosphoserine phosphatase)